MTADVVAVHARRHAGPRASVDGHPDGDPGHPTRRRVIHLPQRRSIDPAAVLAGLPPDTRPAPTVAAYDQLLTRVGEIADAGDHGPVIDATARTS